jgi:Txe/YoeB family toxin of Txe-Axe toxin-antitoxin module
MSYRIALAPVARETLGLVLNQRMRSVLQRQIKALAEKPQQQGLPLVGPLAGCFSLRVEGDWCRMVYRVIGDQVQVLSIATGISSHGRDRDWRVLARRLFRLRLL